MNRLSDVLYFFYWTQINADKHGFIMSFFAFGNKAWAIELRYAKYASNLRFSVLKDQQYRNRPSAAGAYHLTYPCESVPTCHGEGEDGSVSR